MLYPAQCEKAVTNSEPMGRPKCGPQVPTGSKTPLYLPGRVQLGPFPGGLVASYSRLAGTFHTVFSGLQAKRVRRWKRIGGPDHYLLNGHVDPTRSARFGPNFVTILPTGVCVCSI